MMKIRLRISSKSWIWDQYLPENMKWKFGKSCIWDQYLLKAMEWKFGNLNRSNLNNWFLCPIEGTWTFDFSIKGILLPLNIPTPTPAPAHLLGDTRDLSLLSVSRNKNWIHIGRSQHLSNISKLTKHFKCVPARGFVNPKCVAAKWIMRFNQSMCNYRFLSIRWCLSPKCFQLQVCEPYMFSNESISESHIFANQRICKT